MSLLEDPSLKTSSSPTISTSLVSEAYVLSLASLSNCYAASASAPSDAIHLFDKSTLQRLQTFAGHVNGITTLRTVHRLENTSGETLISSGKDGIVRIWDTRSNSATLELSTSGKCHRLLSCDVSSDGMTIAAGTELQGDDAFILYWDPRNPAAPLRTHSSTHSDDITALHFFPSSSSQNILLSASSDGLISTSNADEEDEDEAVLSIGNWGCSVSQAGWILAHEQPKIWAASDMETFSTWSQDLDLIHDEDIRGPSIHNQQRTWVTDYLICGHSGIQSTGPDPMVFVGSNEGDIALISKYNQSDPRSPWSIRRLWTTGHIGVVRSALWDEFNNVLVTGGEDSKINLWPSPPLISILSMEDNGLVESGGDDSMDVDQVISPTSRKRGLDMGANAAEKRKRARWP